MKGLSKKQWRELGVEPPKTAAEMRKETRDKVDKLPIETKREFWRLMTEEKKNLGEARELCGLELMVAADLVVQCHEEITYHRPLNVEEIK